MKRKSLAWAIVWNVALMGAGYVYIGRWIIGIIVFLVFGYLATVISAVLAFNQSDPYIEIIGLIFFLILHILFQIPVYFLVRRHNRKVAEVEITSSTQ